MAISTPTYACKCLNVRIYSRTNPKDVTLSSDDDCIPASVDDDGIVIQHSQLTLRVRSKAVQDSKDSSKNIRHMSLICLNCKSLVYRVSRPASLDGEERPGPVIPTEEWVEKDVLKTSTGLVEVYKGCLTREDIVQEESNPLYSSIFRIVLPSESDTAEPVSPVPRLTPEATSPEPKTHLPTLPSLFLPPPFTPSHPAFTYLSSIANSESQAMRDAAEEYLARVTQEKLAEINAHEGRLRQQTESLWSQFRQGSEIFGGDKRNHLSHGRKEGPKWNGQGNSPSPGALVTVNDFVPTLALHQRQNGGDSTPKASALSASLVNSGFHHPRERTTQNPSTSPQPTTASKPSGSLTPTEIASSPTLTNFIQVDETNDILEPFKRDMSDVKDLATSVLVLTLEAEMERRRRTTRLETVPESSAEGAEKPDTTQPNKDTTKAINGIDRDLTQSPQPHVGHSSASETAHPSSEAKKGKRKVTFDVQPDVVTIKRDVTKEQGADRPDARTNGKAEVSIFDLEEDIDRSSTKEEEEEVLLLHEPPQPPRQLSHKRSRSSGNSGPALPQSFSSLRPISLPPPSGPRIPTTSGYSVPSTKEKSTPDQVISSPEPELANHRFTPDEDDAMLKLVAAHTPSHRGLWDKDNGKALRMIMKERDTNRVSASKSPIDSETASINDEIGWTSYEPPEDIARSLPVSIAPLLPFKNPTKPERPRVPPELPLPLEPKEIVEEGGEGDAELLEGEGRGRERALRIIQARNQLPESGMWRSLA